MTKEQIDKIEKLAREAMGGPWRVRVNPCDPDSEIIESSVDCYGENKMPFCDVGRTYNKGNDAKYIASVSPDVVLKLIQKLKAADELADNFTEWDHRYHDMEDDCQAWDEKWDDDFAPCPDKCTCGLTKIINNRDAYREAGE